MARKAIPEKRYVEAMETMLSDGLRIEEITATNVQKIVGGQYSKIVTIVDNFKEHYLEKQNSEKTPPQAPWFQALATNLAESVANQFNESWFTISQEMTASINSASEAFEQKKNTFEQRLKDNLLQIKKLEADNEKLTLESDKLTDTVEQLKNQVASLSADNKNLKQTQVEIKTECKQHQKENLELNKALSSVEGQMIEKDKLINRFEKN